MTKSTKVNKKAVDNWSKAGKPLFKVGKDGNLYIGSGKRYDQLTSADMALVGFSSEGKKLAVAEPVTPAPVTEQAAPAEAPAPEVAPKKQIIETQVKIQDLKRGDRFRSRENEYEVVYLGGERRSGQGVRAKPVSGPNYQRYLNQLDQNRKLGLTGLASKDTGLIGFSKNNNVIKIEESLTTAVSETITEPAAQPAPAQPEGIAVGNRIKLGKSPQTYIVEEIIPQTANDKKFGEQYYSVRSERKNRDGEYDVQAVLRKDMKLVGGKKALKMAVSDGTISYNQLPENIQKEADFVPNKESTLWKLEQVSVEDLMENSPAGMTGDISEIEGYDIDSLIKSIRKNGVKQPVVVVRNADGSIDIEGNHRVYAAYEAGLDTIPAYVLQQKSTSNIATNKSPASAALRDKNTGEVFYGEPLHGLLHDKIPNIENRDLEAGFATIDGEFITGKETEEKTGMESGEELFQFSQDERREYFEVQRENLKFNNSLTIEEKKSRLSEINQNEKKSEQWNQLQILNEEYLQLYSNPTKNKIRLQELVDLAAKLTGRVKIIASFPNGVTPKLRMAGDWVSLDNKSGRDYQEEYAGKNWETNSITGYVTNNFWIDQQTGWDKGQTLTLTENSVSAEPVIYDGDGNVIPLLERFQPTSPDIRMMAGDIREQQEAVTPIPEANRYTYEEAVRLVDSYFDKEGIPEGVVIVNNTTDPDLEMKAGYFVDRGQIVINLAYIAKGENLSDIISHELGHFIFSDPQFQADFKAFWDLMTPEEQADADRIINQFYNKETGAIQMEEKQVRAFMQLIQDSKAMPKWKQLLDSIKRWINEKLGTNFQVTDRGALSVLAAAHKRFKSGERIIREIDSGVLKTAETAQDAEYLAAVERGDMETAQRMVDEAAEKAGYNSPKVYHGSSDKPFNIFKTKRGKKGTREGGAFFTPTETLANYFATISQQQKYGGITDKPGIIYKAYLKMDNPVVIDQEFENVGSIEDKNINRIKAAKKYGFDGIIWKNTIEPFHPDGVDQYIVFSPEQIKSADPVTYDDAGNVIPLSQRFRTTSPDIRRMAAEPRREQVAGKERGEIITTPEGIIKQTNEVLRKKFFDGSVVSDENTSAAWDYIEQLLDTKSGAANALAGQINDVVDQETNSESRMGASLFSVSLANYAAKLAAQGDMTMLPYIIRRINRMPVDNLAGGRSEAGEALRAAREYQIDGFNTLKTEGKAKVERTAATLFGTDRPNVDQVKIVEDAIKASEDETIGNPDDVAAEIEKVEKRTGRKVIKAIEKKVNESTEPKKEELLISFENLDADKKIKGITIKYSPQKVNVAKNIQNLIIGKMVDYRKTLVNQGAGGLESTFWQTMSNLENKLGSLGELDQAQNNELARIVKNTLIKLGLQGEPDNTKMTDIEKVASILNENKLSDEKRLEADSRIVEEIERRRQSDLASGSSPEAVNAKYDVILDAWNEAMSRQIDMPISDNMLQRLLKSEIKQRNTQIGELINENDGRVTEQVKNDIVDSIIRRIYGVSKEFETGIEMDEDYSNLQSYLKQTINNMYATAIQKKNAAYAKRQAERSLKNNVDAQAQSIINQLSTELSDTPSFSPQIENKVKVIVQQDLRQNPDMGRKQPWTSQLTAKLIDAGVDETQAQTISELTWRQHEIKKMDRDLKELKTAAEKGSLAVIIDRIKTTPLEKQQEPNWMQDVIREYLVDAGLSGNAADTAARLYESVISERLAEAKQKAFETTLNKSAPWKNYLSRNSSLGKEALKRIQDAIRTGVLDPTQNVESIIAKENGWSGFTKEQFQRIVQLDNVISNPESDEVTKAEAMAELNKIIVKAKIPVRFKDAIGAYYVGQALMGIPTVTVNIASPIGFSVRNLITDIGRYAFTEPSRIPMAFETFLDSMKSWYNQTSYAFRNQIYLNDVVEYLNGQNVLRELFDKGKAQWARGEYANGMANMLVGMTQITGRVLSALDQGSISMLENQNITRYAMEAMKQRNIPQSKRKEIANMILDTRRRTYAENIASGMEKDRAGVLADMAVRNELISALAPEGIDLKDVLASAINDSLQSVGRNKVINTKGIEAENKRLSDAGMLSYLPIKFLEDIASGASSGNPLMQVFSKMLYGFALVPARVFHTTAWYSPYGFIRLGIDKYKKNKGEESPYAMSLQTDLQYKQRLTESIAGSIVMLGLAALAGSSTDDEEEKKFRIVITGNGPSYSADRQYFDSWNKKWKPYSIHIVMGDTIIPINIGRGGEALFFPIMLAGALDDWNIKKKLNLTKKSPEDLNFAVEALGSAFFALAQRGPYAAFTKPLFDASKEGKITEELVSQAGFFGKTFVPILGASVARNISDFINDPVDRSSLEGAIYANTPVIGPWMGAKALNALGQPVRADDWGDKLYKLGSPVVFSFPKNTPENELNELILKKGSGPSIPTRSNAQKRFGDVMTDKEFETYVREYGRVVSGKMFKNRKKLENMSLKNYDDELQRYVTGYSIDGIKISGASDMAVRAVKKMRTQ
jgi:hypothetical protein